MPSLPKSRKRPWLSERKLAKQTGRKVKNPFYQTMPWRNFRERQKKIAMARTKEIMEKLIAEQKLPIPEALMREKPLCEQCLKGNVFGPVYRSANVLDHIKPINPENAYDTAGGKYGEPLDPENVQWLCEKHHASKSGAEHQFHAKK